MVAEKERPRIKVAARLKEGIKRGYGMAYARDRCEFVETPEDGAEPTEKRGDGAPKGGGKGEKKTGGSK